MDAASAAAAGPTGADGASTAFDSATPPLSGPANGTTQTAQPHALHRLHPRTPPHAVGETIRLAMERGFSHARLALNPPELGGVEVLLRSSSAGLVATLTADSPDAARMLQEAGGDLRHQLEGQGIELLRLDVGVADDRRPAGGDGGAAASGDRGGDAIGTPDEPPPARERIDLGGGVLIDVVA